MKLLEDNALHSDVINSLIEEVMNIMAHSPDRCTVWLLAKRVIESMKQIRNA